MQHTTLIAIRERTEGADGFRAALSFNHQGEYEIGLTHDDAGPARYNRADGL